MIIALAGIECTPHASRVPLHFSRSDNAHVARQLTAAAFNAHSDQQRRASCRRHEWGFMERNRNLGTIEMGTRQGEPLQGSRRMDVHVASRLRLRRAAIGMT